MWENNHELGRKFHLHALMAWCTATNKIFQNLDGNIAIEVLFSNCQTQLRFGRTMFPSQCLHCYTTKHNYKPKSYYNHDILVVIIKILYVNNCINTRYYRPLAMLFTINWLLHYYCCYEIVMWSVSQYTPSVLSETNTLHPLSGMVPCWDAHTVLSLIMCSCKLQLDKLLSINSRFSLGKKGQSLLSTWHI